MEKVEFVPLMEARNRRCLCIVWSTRKTSDDLQQHYSVSLSIMRPTAVRSSGMPEREPFYMAVKKKKLTRRLLVSQSLREFLHWWRDNRVTSHQNPWWGDTSNLKQRGIITYSECVLSSLVRFNSIFYTAVSPFRQRPTKQIFQGWMFNGYKRLASQVPYWIVPFAIGAFPRVSMLHASDYDQPMAHTIGRSDTMLGRTARLDTLRCMVPIDALVQLVTLEQ